MTNIKREIKERAWLVRGLVNSLNYDADYIRADVENYDLICMGESIREIKATIQNLIDNVTELEYLLYLLRQDK